MATRTLLLGLLLVGCHPFIRARADGGTEWGLEDGGWVGAGDGCGCAHEGDELLQDGSGPVVLWCARNPDRPSCDRTDPTGCPAEVCFGARCCVWLPP